MGWMPLGDGTASAGPALVGSTALVLSHFPPQCRGVVIKVLQGVLGAPADGSQTHSQGPSLPQCPRDL